MFKNRTKLKYSLFALVVLILVIAAYFLFFSGNNENSNGLITVKKGEISEIVRITGKTLATKEVDLGFEVTGKIKQVNAPISANVKIGDSLVSLDTDQLRAELAIAQATLEADRASLSDTVDGTRPEEIAVSEAKIISAESSLYDAYSQLRDSHLDSYTKADDAIRNRIDQFFTNPETDPKIVFSTSDFNLEQKIESGRSNVKNTLERLSANTTALIDNSEYLDYSEKIKTDLGIVKNFLDDVAMMINTLDAGSSLPQSSIDGYKSSVVTARTNISGAVTALLTVEEKVRTAKTALLVAQQNLNVLKAGSTGSQIKIAEAKVRQSEANVQKIQVQVSKSTLRAPFSGVVTKQDAKIGQVVSQNQTVMSMIGDEGIEIEAQIPEVDIGRVKIGNPVRITIDAFAGENFSGKITYIEPAETIIDGVVNYKSTIRFDNVDTLARIRSGLTVNLYIETEYSDSALIIPQFAVIETDEGIFVEKDVNGKKERTAVTLGIRGEEGMLEIISGVEEGDKVYNVGLKSE